MTPNFLASIRYLREHWMPLGQTLGFGENHPHSRLRHRPLPNHL